MTPTSLPTEDVVFTIDEAARYLKCGPKVVRRLCKLGKIRNVKLDRKKTVRIHKSAIDAFLLGEKAA